MKLARASRLAVLVISATLIAVPAMRAEALPAALAQPLPIEGISAPVPPDMSATNWVLWDDTYQRELASLGADERRPMASTTKMMTAIVALENGSMDDLVTVSAEAAAVGEATILLRAGETLPLGDLLHALLMQSANDAAVAVAEHIAGDVDSFVAMMNSKARELGLENTAFVNPHGLDAPGHYSSAHDLLTIALYGMENPDFATMVDTPSYEMTPAPDGTRRTARSTNELIRTYDGAFGVKTGYTDGAGLTLVAAAERAGRKVYTVVMNSEDHFLDTAQLLNYGFLEYQLLALIDPSEIEFTIRTPAGSVAAIPEEEIDAFLSSTEQEAVVVSPSFDDGVPTATATVSGEEIGHTALAVEEAAELPGVIDSVSWASRYWDWVWGLRD